MRHRNLQHLIAEVLRPRGITKNKDASQALGGLGDSYLSQLKSGKKMGDDTARRIEQALGLRHGAMDSPLWYPTGVKEPPVATYANEMRPQLTMREQALLDNYRAADESTKTVVDAAALAGAKSGLLKKAK